MGGPDIRLSTPECVNSTTRESCINRVRMAAASFLVKDLLIPWQEGAAWFWERLADADLANNTLGWQWTAGCGADAAPFFRIFNPVTQGEKFDPGRLLHKTLDPGNLRTAASAGCKNHGRPHAPFCMKPALKWEKPIHNQSWTTPMPAPAHSKPTKKLEGGTPPNRSRWHKR